MGDPRGHLTLPANTGPVGMSWTGRPIAYLRQTWSDTRRRKRYANVMKELLPRIGETIQINVPAVDAYTDLEYELVRPKRSDLIPYMVEQHLECLVDDAVRTRVWNTFVGGFETQASILLDAIRMYPDIRPDDRKLLTDLSEIELSPFTPGYHPGGLADDAGVHRVILSNTRRGNSFEVERCRGAVSVITNNVPAFVETVAATATEILQIGFSGHGSDAAEVELVAESSRGIVVVQVTGTTTYSNLDFSVGRSPNVPRHADVNVKTCAVRRYGLIKALISGALYEYDVSETLVVVMAVSDLLRNALKESGCEGAAEERRREEVRSFLSNVSTFCGAMNSITEAAVRTCGKPTGKEGFLANDVRLKINRASPGSEEVDALRKRAEPGREVRNRVEQMLLNRISLDKEFDKGRRYPLRDCYVSTDVSEEVSLVVLEAVKKKLHLEAVKKKLRLSMRYGERQAGTFLEIYVKRQLLGNELTEADRERLVGHRRYETYQDTGSELAVCLPDRDIMLVYPKYSELDYVYEPMQIASMGKPREAILSMVMLPKVLECEEQDEFVERMCDQSKKSVRSVIENKSDEVKASFLRVVAEKGIRLTRLCDKVYSETHNRDYLDRHWMIREVLAYAASQGVGPTLATESNACYIDAVMAVKGVKMVSRKIECDRQVDLDGTICYELEFDEHGNRFSSVGVAKRVMLAVEGKDIAVEVEGYEQPGRQTRSKIGSLKLTRHTGRLEKHFRRLVMADFSVA